VATSSGLKYVITAHGAGPRARPGQVIVAHFTALPDGKVVPKTRDTPAAPSHFILGEALAPWLDQAFSLLRVGDKATVILPPQLTPGHQSSRYEVELLDLKAYDLATVLRNTIDSAGLEAALRRYAELKATRFADHDVHEGRINYWGYRYLEKGNTAAAIALFKINVELFPQSWNVYDSLGEAYMKSGQRELGIQNYQRSLELKPQNGNGEQ
jgi:tetratricopeptide (TPR) repeat protein